MPHRTAQRWAPLFWLGAVYVVALALLLVTAF